MTPKVMRFWLNKIPTAGEKQIIELRVDFDNDRHHAMEIEEPHGAQELARALDELAMHIRADPHLRPILSGNTLTT